MNKNILGVTTLVVLSVIISIGYYLGFSGEKVSANPDYICTKSVTDQPCIVDDANWSNWNNDGKRTGTGVMTTEFKYKATRTGCESGYSARVVGQIGGNSGRRTADFVSQSTICTIIQEDVIPPVGNITNN